MCDSWSFSTVMMMIRRRMLARSCWKATPFLREAVSNMFGQHSRSRYPSKNTPVNGDHQASPEDDEDAFLDKEGIASWMNQCLRDEDETVGRHEKRVTHTLARYGTAGGRMSEADFLQMYVSVMTTGEDATPHRKDDEQPMFTTLEELERHCAPEIQAVWRDLRSHGIVGPAEFERNMKVAELQKAVQLDDDDDVMMQGYNILDECEILDESQVEQASLTTDRHGKSSHERVELVPTAGGSAAAKADPCLGQRRRLW